VRRQRVSAFGVVVAALLIGGCGLLGLLVGRTGRIATADASLAQSTSALDAFLHAERAAYGAGWHSGYRLGWRHGEARARVLGRRAGAAAAQARADTVSHTTAADAVRRLLAGAVTPSLAGSAKQTFKCVQVGGGLCEVLAPPGRPCPAGSVPDPATGRLCVPELLIGAYRQAETAAVSGPGV
jgi:hypothetical protein